MMTRVPDRSNGKVVLIGLDGLTFKVIRPLVEAGVMPTVARFMKEGASGTLWSTRPPVTCPAWPSMFTGVNPGRHGVFSFTCRDAKTGKARSVGSTDIRARKIWDLMGDAGRRVAVLNVPITFPASRVNGVMLTGYVSPENSPHVTFPATTAQELRDEFGDLALNWDVLGYRPSDPAEREAHVRRINELMVLRCRQFQFLIEKNQPDFCFFVHEYPDRVQHLFYHLLDADFDAYHAPENRKARDLLIEGHRELDASLAKLVETFGEDANYMIVSDHGFGGVTRWVYVNNLLNQHGLLSVKRLKAWGDVLTRRMNLSKSTRQRLGFEHRDPSDRQDPCREPLIAYRRSRAFAGPQLEHSVYVNVAGRCPDGTVDAGEDRARLQRELVDLLSNARDAGTGKRVFDGAWTRDALYQGDYVDEAPDIIYELAPGYMVSNAVLPPGLMNGRFVRPIGAGWDISGYHLPDGVLIGYGPAFRAASNLDAHLLDVAPTALYLMNLPIPSYMEGRVVEEALRNEVLQTRSPETSESELSTVGNGELAYTAEEQMEVTRRLEELGYL